MCMESALLRKKVVSIVLIVDNLCETKIIVESVKALFILAIILLSVSESREDRASSKIKNELG